MVTGHYCFLVIRHARTSARPNFLCSPKRYAASENKTEIKAKLPRVVFVSVDPQRDELDRLQKYAEYYHPDFVGVTAEQTIIDGLCRSLGVFYERVYYRDGKILELEPGADIPGDVEDSYLINHASSVFLLNPEGRLHAIFAPPHDAQKIIGDLVAIQSGWES